MALQRAIQSFVGRILGFMAILVAIGLATPLAPYAAAIEAALGTAGLVLAAVAIGVELANLAFRIYDLYQHDFAVAFGLHARFQLDDELVAAWNAIAGILINIAAIIVAAVLFVILVAVVAAIKKLFRVGRRGGRDGDGDHDRDRDRDHDRDRDQNDDRDRDGDEDGDGDGDGGPPKLRSGTASPYEFNPGVTLGPEDEPIINRLRNRMNKRGWQGEPIVVRFRPDGTKEILDGHHRVAAAKRTRKSIQVPWREATPEEVQFYLRHRQQ